MLRLTLLTLCALTVVGGCSQQKRAQQSPTPQSVAQVPEVPKPLPPARRDEKVDCSTVPGETGKMTIAVFGNTRTTEVVDLNSQEARDWPGVKMTTSGRVEEVSKDQITISCEKGIDRFRLIDRTVFRNRAGKIAQRSTYKVGDIVSVTWLVPGVESPRDEFPLTKHVRKGGLEFKLGG